MDSYSTKCGNCNKIVTDLLMCVVCGKDDMCIDCHQIHDREGCPVEEGDNIDSSWKHVPKYLIEKENIKKEFFVTEGPTKKEESSDDEVVYSFCPKTESITYYQGTKILNSQDHVPTRAKCIECGALRYDRDTCDIDLYTCDDCGKESLCFKCLHDHDYVLLKNTEKKESSDDEVLDPILSRVKCIECGTIRYDRDTCDIDLYTCDYCDQSICSECSSKHLSCDGRSKLQPSTPPEKENIKKEFFITEGPTKKEESSDDEVDEELILKSSDGETTATPLRGEVRVRPIVSTPPKINVCLHMSYILPDPKKNKTESYCAMTGPFKDKYMTFREKYLGKTRLFNWAHYRYNLLVGHTPGTRGGWLFPHSKVEEMKSALEKEGILFSTSTFDQNIRTERRRTQKREQARRYRLKKRTQLLKEYECMEKLQWNDTGVCTCGIHDGFTINQKDIVVQKSEKPKPLKNSEKTEAPQEVETTIGKLDNDPRCWRRDDEHQNSEKNEEPQEKEELVAILVWGDIALDLKFRKAFDLRFRKGDKISISRCITCGDLCLDGKKTTCCEKYACTDCIVECQCGDDVCVQTRCKEENISNNYHIFPF